MKSREGRYEVTIRRFLRAAATSLAVAAVLAQTPGPSDPHDPAPWACSPTDRAHPCSCHRQTDPDDPVCEGPIKEDAKCARYCVPDKCHCPVHCAHES